MAFLFRFGKNKNKTSNKSNVTDNGHNNFTSRDVNASGSLAEAMLFPMQYNGPTYDFSSFPDELLFIPYTTRNDHHHHHHHHHNNNNNNNNNNNDESNLPTDPSNLFSSNGKKLNHKYGVSALLIHGNPRNNPTHFMILFHGNGVDLGMAAAMWRPLIRALPIHLLIVEYPGYGIMDGRCTCKQVIKVAENTYKYVTRSEQNGGLGIDPDKLIILGRSIGTGPASHIAKKPCHTLILVSPFTSIHNLSSDLMGKWTKYLLPKDFTNNMMDNDDDDDYGNDDDDDNIKEKYSFAESEEEEENYNNYPSNGNKEEIPNLPAPTLNKSVSNPIHPKLSLKEERTQNEYKYNKDMEQISTSVISIDEEEEEEEEKNKEVALDLNEVASPDLANLEETKEQANEGLLYSQTSPVDHRGPKITTKYHNNGRYKPNDLQQRLQRSQTHKVIPSTKKVKRNNHQKRKSLPSFVFNNVTQIEKWQCKNFMVFHGKNDELIPFDHTNKIVAEVKNKKPELKPKKFLIDGVGHNDVNIQFIGLRIFMQYQEELQPSFSDDSKGIDIDSIVPYLDNPPQFDIITNKVQNFGYKPPKKSKSKRKKKTGMGKLAKKISSPSNVFGPDSDDDDENNLKNMQLINEWDCDKGEFNQWRNILPTKIYDLSTKLKLESQKKQMQKATQVISSKWI